MWLPVERDWRLNERHYGALQGLDKAETTAKYGAEQVKIWRRSYDMPPSPLAADDPRHPRFDRRYRGIPPAQLPATESLERHTRPRRALLARAPRAGARQWRRRARRRPRQQPARARQDAGRDERRRRSSNSTSRPACRSCTSWVRTCARRRRGASWGTQQRSKPQRAPSRHRPRSASPAYSSGAISTSMPARAASNGIWQDSREPCGR